jgi:hypothetical protein
MYVTSSLSRPQPVHRTIRITPDACGMGHLGRDSDKSTDRKRLAPRNAQVQLQARSNHCDEVASEKCLSAATFVRHQPARSCHRPFSNRDSPSSRRGHPAFIYTRRTQRTAATPGELRPSSSFDRGRDELAFELLHVKGKGYLGVFDLRCWADSSCINSMNATSAVGSHRCPAATLGALGGDSLIRSLNPYRERRRCDGLADRLLVACA